jgi:glycosyltransferase involved in cell wall biosynthesis
MFDDQIFSLQNYGGISRYFFEIASRLSGSGGLEARLPFPISNNGYLGQGGPLQKRPFLPKHRFKGRRFLVQQFNRLFSSRALTRGQFEVFHPTYYNPYFLGRLGNKPFVLTIYDMIHEIFPEHFANEPVAKWKSLLIPKAERIIAISHHTKRDILRFHDIDERKIRVIHLSDSFQGDFTPREYPGLPERFLLFMGNRGLYKNFTAMIRSLAPLLIRDPSLQIVCVGSEPFDAEELALFRDLGLMRRVIGISVSDAHLAFIYGKAQAFIFPSRYEGFGIPILEAFRCGCPALLAKASCFPEIAGDAALYFDLDDPEDLEKAVVRVLADPALRGQLADKGRKRAALFSWEKTAQETFEIYAGLIG